MALRRQTGALSEIILVALTVTLVASHALGQPLLLTYVESGSMEPTIKAGDGFVAIPTQITGPPEEGDVVVFRARELHGGGLTTHRVVDVTDRGVITKGDANPFADQEGVEPPVQEPQVVATAWRPGGEVLVIPEVGTAITSTRSVIEAVQTRLAILLGTRVLLGGQGLGYLLFALSLFGYAIAAWRDTVSNRRPDRRRDRNTGLDTRLLLVGLAVVVMFAATAAMVVPGGVQEFGIVSSETDSSSIRVIERGTSQSTNYPVRNEGLLPITVFLEPRSEGVEIEPRALTVGGRATGNVALTLTAPSETGYYRLYFEDHRYLSIFPRMAIRSLYEVHPWLPIVAIDVLLGCGFYLVGATVVGTRRIRFRTRTHPSPIRRLLP